MLEAVLTAFREALPRATRASAASALPEIYGATLVRAGAPEACDAWLAALPRDARAWPLAHLAVFYRERDPARATDLGARALDACAAEARDAVRDYLDGAPTRTVPLDAPPQDWRAALIPYADGLATPRDVGNVVIDVAWSALAAGDSARARFVLRELEDWLDEIALDAPEETLAAGAPLLPVAWSANVDRVERLLAKPIAARTVTDFTRLLRAAMAVDGADGAQLLERVEVELSGWQRPYLSELDGARAAAYAIHGRLDEAIAALDPRRPSASTAIVARVAIAAGRKGEALAILDAAIRSAETRPAILSLGPAMRALDAPEILEAAWEEACAARAQRFTP